MQNYPKKKTVRYPVNIALKIDPDTDANIKMASANGIDTAEYNRQLLREGYKRLISDMKRSS